MNKRANLETREQQIQASKRRIDTALMDLETRDLAIKRLVASKLSGLKHMLADCEINPDSMASFLHAANEFANEIGGLISIEPAKITDPSDGGCWFCYQTINLSDIFFSKEFDCYVHKSCIYETIRITPTHCEANLMRAEIMGFEHMLAERGN